MKYYEHLCFFKHKINKNKIKELNDSQKSG